MQEKQPVRHVRDRKDRNNHANDIELNLLQGEDQQKGENLIKALNSAKMVAVLSGMEIMYVFAINHNYECFIHKFDAEDGRHKAFPINPRNTAMMKNLTAAADKIFVITPKPTMNPLGVMQAAEKGIISFLDATGQLPAEDVDFMKWQQSENDEEEQN